MAADHHEAHSAGQQKEWTGKPWLGKWVHNPSDRTKIWEAFVAALPRNIYMIWYVNYRKKPIWIFWKNICFQYGAINDLAINTRVLHLSNFRTPGLERCSTLSAFRHTKKATFRLRTFSRSSRKTSSRAHGFEQAGGRVRATALWRWFTEQIICVRFRFSVSPRTSCKKGSYAVLCITT